jgi:protein TonB
VPARPIGGEVPRPPYPNSARRRNEQGRVVVRAVVAPDGTPSSLTVAQSSGSPSLDDAALNAVRAAHFTPATRGGKPIEGTAEVPFLFKLE